MNDDSPELQRLIDQLGDDDIDIRRAAACELGWSRGEEVTAALTQAIKEPHRSVREAAGDSLLQQGPSLAARYLVGDTGNERTEAGNLAVNLLIQMGTEASGYVHCALTDRDKDVRKAAAEILGAIGAPRSVDGLIARVDDPGLSVAFGAIEALGNIGEQLNQMLGIPVEVAATQQALRRTLDGDAELGEELDLQKRIDSIIQRANNGG